MVTIYSVVIRARDIVANKINRLAGASWAIAAVAAGRVPRDLNGNSHKLRPTAITDSVSGTGGPPSTYQAQFWENDYMNQQLRAQQQFTDHVQQLATMLCPLEGPCAINVLLKDLRRAVQARREGYGYGDAEGHAWHRAEWRVRYGVVDPAQVEDALLLLRTIVSLGMPVFERIGWDQDETAALVAALRDQAGIEVWL